MYCNAKRSLGKGRNCQLAMSRQGSTFSRRVATKGSKWVFLAASGIGAMKVVSNKIDETHGEVSKNLSLPYDTMADGLNSLAMSARSYSHYGRSYLDKIDELKNSFGDSVAGFNDILNGGDEVTPAIPPLQPLKPIEEPEIDEEAQDIQRQIQEVMDSPVLLEVPLPELESEPSQCTIPDETLVQHQEVLEKLSLELEEKERLMEELDATQNERDLKHQEELGILSQELKEKERLREELDSMQNEKDLKHQEELGKLAQEIKAKEEAMNEKDSKFQEEKERLKEELAEAQNVALQIEELLQENKDLKSKINSDKSDSHRTETELRKELLKLQESYKRELDKYRSENEQLKFLVKNSNLKTSSVKKSIIDMYAEVLDTLSDNDNTYKIQDHLPRIVVVGDQSAGKTSVLEMIVRARIFPRGHGEMMTRSPVQVTLGEGNRHTAQFNGDDRVFDLSSEAELKELRAAVEGRMTKNLKPGETVSSEVISLTVKGPGLHRMVLVDLPGIISTETRGMMPKTKEALTEMAAMFMRNPNAIILCVQDGSIDAERSNVTNIVQAHDPKGKRTIFVLTKVDLAEQNMLNPTRVKKILEGKLFPMKALGYYAVVTGRGPQDDSIETIRAYEEDFFSRSKLFRSGAMRASQMSTNNLSLAVSDCFWKMVSDSVEQQADNFKAARYNLEAEWRNTFSGIREMDRNDLFEKAKDDILDDIAALHKSTPLEWETLLQENLWEEIHPKVVDDIYLGAAECTSSSNFNTKVDIALKDWTDDKLPQMAINVGWQTLFKQLETIMTTKKADREIGDLFQPLKANILETVKAQHAWQSTALKRLSVIQKNALEDTAVTNKMQWDNSISFMERILKERIDLANDNLERCIGPSWTERWTGWRSRSPLESQCVSAKNELQKLLVADEMHSKHLENDELTTVRRNLQTQGVDVPYEIICTVWEKLYAVTFLTRALSSAQQCRKAFYHRSIACNAVECNDVVLFWRATRMLETTSNALRLQIMNTEAQRLEQEVKQYLDELSRDEENKKRLITGKRVDLAEELRKVRSIQDKLELFIAELNKDQ
ncbi:dynamin-like 120 kDa protein, mitochondrial isoform X4 [Bolinopsis microptera]|uniref:dynamin-like 120 kDa protein, mitochondrial isoform X4 n=1 Tax=Bolinopsis microptera TaxID=2820187 RepID=UPI00307A68F1